MELGVIPADTPDIAGGLDLGGDLPVLDVERDLVGNDLPAQVMVQRNAVRVEQGEGFALLVHLGQADVYKRQALACASEMRISW